MSRAEKTKQLILGTEHLDKELSTKLILDEDIKPTDVTDEQYSRFLKLAVESRDTPLVRKLLEARPKIDGIVGAQLLWQVIDDDDTRITEMLVRAGADVNQSFNERSSSLLQVLAKSNDRRKLKLALLMMEHRADVMVKDVHGSTVLEFAMKHGNLPFAQEILKQGVEIDDDILYRSIVWSPKPVQSMLLIVNGDHIKDATTRSKLVANAFTVLCARFEVDGEDVLDMVKALLDLEIPPIDVILQAVRCEKFNVVKLLLERTDIKRSVKMTLLIDAVRLPRTIMARLLIEWGADIDYKDPEELYSSRSMRPLHIACIYSSRPNIQLLLHLGADVNAADRYEVTPFAFLILNLELGTNFRSYAQLTETCRLIVKHFALLNSKGATLNEHDLAHIKSHPILQQFYNECLAELQEMKEVRIISGSSFYCIFTKSIQYLSLLTRRQTFVEGYNNQLNSFPAYRSDLNMRIREAERRKKLLKPKEVAIYESLREILPDVPIEIIIQYLYLREVETLKDRIMMLDFKSDELYMM